MENIVVRGVQIGDQFKTGKHTSATVVDLAELKSLITGETIKQVCFAKSNGLASNTFEVPFTTVLRNKTNV